jgi:hypothetical protein
LRINARTASRPIFAAASSWFDVPVEHPIAPSMSPLPDGQNMGMPPPRVQKRPEIALPMPEVALPGQAFSWSGGGVSRYLNVLKCKKYKHADVGIRLPAAVKAMSIAVLMDVIFEPSIRVKLKRWQCASTTAMDLSTC